MSVLQAVAAEGVLHRVGRAPDPWELPDWAYAGVGDRTFGNRYDDPAGLYRVLYASSDRVAPFVETLARFRPDPAVLAALEGIGGEDDEPPTAPGGVVPRGWLASRRVGSARFDGRFADVSATASLTHLRTRLAAELVRHQLEDLDASDVRSRAPRALTQAISRHVYEAGVADGGPFDGIRYRSRLGDELVNWAIFEECEPREPQASVVEPGDPDLGRALELLGLLLEP